MKVKTSTKLAIRIVILTVGLVATFIAANMQPVSVADGGPILTCGQNKPICGFPPA